MASDILVTFDANLGGNALAKLEEIRAQLEALVKGTHEIKVNVNGQDVIKQLNNIASGKTGGKKSGGKKGLASGIAQTMSSDVKAVKEAVAVQEKAIRQIEKSQVKRQSSSKKTGLTGAIKLQTAELQTQKQLLSEMMSTVDSARRKIRNSPILSTTQKNDELDKLKLLKDDLNRFQNTTKTLGYNSPESMRDITKRVDSVRQRVKALKEEEDASKRVAAAEKKRAEESAKAAAKQATSQENQMRKNREANQQMEADNSRAFAEREARRAKEAARQAEIDRKATNDYFDAEEKKEAKRIEAEEKAFLARRKSAEKTAAREAEINSKAESKALQEYEKGQSKLVADEAKQAEEYERAYLARRKAAQKQMTDAEKDYNKVWSAAEKSRQGEINKQVKAAETKLAKYERDYQKLRAGQFGDSKEVLNLGNQLSQVQKLAAQAKDIKLYDPEATGKLNELSSAVSKLGTSYETVKAKAKEFGNTQKVSAKEAAMFARQSESMQKKIQDFIDKNPRVAGTSYEQQLQTLTGRMQARVSSGKGTAKDLKGYEDQFKRIKAAAADAGKVGQTLGQSIAGAVKQFGGWMLVTHSIMTVINSIKGMIANVQDLDKEMTELKKVTDLTSTAYDEFYDRAKVRAKETGATLTDTIRATSDMARLGYSVPDAEKMADAATIYKNVGDGIESIDEASQSVISTVKAFGLNANDALTVVDKYNEVGNNFAVSSAGLGEAMVRSASAMAAAGNTLDETLALIAAGNEVVQDPQKMGELLRPAA